METISLPQVGFLQEAGRDQSKSSQRHSCEDPLNVMLLVRPGLEPLSVLGVVPETLKN